MTEQPRDKSLVPATSVVDEEVAQQVRELARLGLSKNAVRLFLKMRFDSFDRLYGEAYLEGQANMQRRLAGLAMEQAEAGNVPMLMYLCKTKLGWNETSVVEHVGEVRTVVSAIPLTRDEFAKKYLGHSSSETSTEVIDVTETQATSTPIEVESSVYYYLCPHCKHIGIVVTSCKWVSCGQRWCEKKFLINTNYTTEAHYRRVWWGIK